MTAVQERIAKIPQAWIREHIRGLEQHIRSLEERNEELEAQVRLAAGEHAEAETNVRLQADDIGIALPAGALIIFQDKFEVEPSVNDPDGITIELPRGEGLVIILDTEDRIFVRAGMD